MGRESAFYVAYWQEAHFWCLSWCKLMFVVIEMYTYFLLFFFFFFSLGGIAIQLNQLCVATAFASQDRGVHHETVAQCFRVVIAFCN